MPNNQYLQVNRKSDGIRAVGWTRWTLVTVELKSVPNSSLFLLLVSQDFV